MIGYFEKKMIMIKQDKLLLYKFSFEQVPLDCYKLLRWMELYQ